jgi:hypothetical protein
MKQQLSSGMSPSTPFFNMVSSSTLPFGFVGEADRQFRDQWGSATPLWCFPWICLKIYSSIFAKDYSICYLKLLLSLTFYIIFDHLSY